MGYENTVEIPRDDLATIAAEYIDRIENFVALEAFPEMNAPSEKFEFPYIKIEELLNVHETRRAEDGTYPRFTSRIDWQQVDIGEHGHEAPIQDDDRARYARWFNVEASRTRLNTGIVIRGIEREAAALVEGTSLDSFDTGATDWTDTANGTPITDAELAHTAMIDQCGVEPDSVIMTDVVRRKLNLNAEIRAALIYTTPLAQQTLTDQTIKDALGIKNLYVAASRKNTADKGQAATPEPVWSSNFVTFFKRSEGEDFDTPEGMGFARTPIWRASSPTMFFVESYRHPETRADIVRCRSFAGPRIMSARFAHRLSGTAGA